MTHELPHDEYAEYERDESPPTEYPVTMPDGSETTVDDAELAEAVARSGGTVGPARTGWE